MKYMLDTNICIYVIKNRPQQVFDTFIKHQQAGLGISSITAAELWYGAQKSGSSKNLRALRQFLSPLEIAAFDASASEHYGQLRTTLESQGTPIGPLDTQIAAHALALGVTLVTNNTREFARVNNLKLENWA
jgi:tRNA(fMet)-specific endonuclease VapC